MQDESMIMSKPKMKGLYLTMLRSYITFRIDAAIAEEINKPLQEEKKNLIEESELRFPEMKIMVDTLLKEKGFDI